jgi:hypothetical protein
MLTRFLGWLAGLLGRPVFGAGRDPRWRAVRAAHLRGQPECQACAARRGLEVHHVEPVHLRPDRELDPGNLITLCRACHFAFGHCWDWGLANPEVRADCNQWRHKRRLAEEARARRAA